MNRFAVPLILTFSPVGRRELAGASTKPFSPPGRRCREAADEG